MTLQIGDPAPDFTLLNQNREPVSLSDLEGSKSVIVFIPFAFTRTCEGELCQIRDEYSMFDEFEARVVAITCNTLHANKVWAEQQGFQFDLLSDWWPHGAVSRAYDTFNEEHGYAERTTYFLDADGVITDVTQSEHLGAARDFDVYRNALKGVSGGS
jgi:mycoredoxin-dependent peroxiredoxin